MEKRVISLKLESLRRCVKRIEDKMPADAFILETDFDVQDIISVNIERAVQQCVDIASHLLADHDDVAGQSAASLFKDLTTKGIVAQDLGDRLSRACGFRNLLVHRYATIDWRRVFQSLSSDIDVFARFASSISRHCEM